MIALERGHLFLITDKMKNRSYLVLLLPLLFSCSGSTVGVEDFSWLDGKWEGHRSDMVTFEHWSPAEGKSMQGIGGVVMRSDTVFAEKIRIEERADGLYYVASVPGNPAPVDFKFKGFENDTAVFENLQHDFPQRVLYIKTKDGMFACVEGKQDNKFLREEFSFQKVSKH
jgi:hypothetical protein